MRRLIFILATSAILPVQGQQVTYFRNEIYSPQWHNPASFGIWNTFSVNVSGQTYAYYNDFFYGSGLISAEGFLKTGNNFSGVGVGATYLFDGFYGGQTHSGSLKLNYQFGFSKFGLAIGVAPGFKTINQRTNWLPPSNVQDPNLPATAAQTKATMDAGVHVFTDKFYAGVSVCQLNQANYDEIQFQAAAHYFFNAGYRFKASRNIQLFPAATFGTDGAVNHLTTTLLVQFMKPAVTVGLGYGTARFARVLVGYDWKGFSLLYSIGSNFALLSNAVYFDQELRLTYKIRKPLKCSTCEHF